jgi:hypothetical protein
LSPEYLAGFFDGEGTFQVNNQTKNGKTYRHHAVMLSQSGEDGLRLLEEIQAIYDGRIYQHLKAGQHKATKAAYKLYWRKDEATRLIPQLLPYLRLKREAAQEVFTYITRK